MLMSPSPAVPKTSFINRPLWVALLITSILHFVFISGISAVFPKIAQQQKTVEITLIKIKPETPLPVKKLPESVTVPKKIVEIPVAKPAHQNAESANKPKPKKRRIFSQPIPKTSAPRIATVAIPDIPTVAPVIVEPIPVPKADEIAPVVPTVIEPSINKPAEVEKVVVASDSAPPEIMDKPVDVPVKPSKKARKKAVKKTSSGIDNVQPVLSMDDLAAQIAQVGEKFGNQAPSASESRIKSLNSIREHKASARQYKQDWRAKIERIANLNYPEAARQKYFSARLVMEVGINADGSIHSIRVKKSSGTPALDEAAKNIVQMGAPFAALPKDLAAEVDVLVLQQPMQFSDESGVIAQ
jgi:protein TonB